jgi:hypothetical protein
MLVHTSLGGKPKIIYPISLLNKKNIPCDLADWQRDLVSNPLWTVWLVSWEGSGTPNFALHVSDKHFTIRRDKFNRTSKLCWDECGYRSFDCSVAVWDEDMQHYDTTLDVCYLPDDQESRNHRMLIFFYYPTIWRSIKAFLCGLFPRT